MKSYKNIYFQRTTSTIVNHVCHFNGSNHFCMSCCWLLWQADVLFCIVLPVEEIHDVFRPVASTELTVKAALIVSTCN